MASRVLDGATGGAFDLVTSGIDALVEAGVEPFDPQDAITSIRELEVQVRRLRALQVEQLSATTGGDYTASMVTRRPR
jgi:hypothetical protein